MSGTTNPLNDPNVIAGIGTAAVDGTLYNISDVTWSAATVSYEWLKGYNGPHGKKATYEVPFIQFTVRQAKNMKASDFLAMQNSEVTVKQANGVTVSGHSMGCMNAFEVDTNEATFQVRFEGPQVIES